VVKGCVALADAGTSHAGYGNCGRHGGCVPNGRAYAARTEAVAAAERVAALVGYSIPVVSSGDFLWPIRIDSGARAYGALQLTHIYGATRGAGGGSRNHFR
jgi:hypothetical protein